MNRRQFIAAAPVAALAAVVAVPTLGSSALVPLDRNEFANNLTVEVWGVETFNSFVRDMSVVEAFGTDDIEVEELNSLVVVRYRSA